MINTIDARSLIAGLTPKGYKRLKELKHEWKTWLRRNGFAVAIATITALAAIGSIIVDATCNRG